MLGVVVLVGHELGCLHLHEHCLQLRVLVLILVEGGLALLAVVDVFRRVYGDARHGFLLLKTSTGVGFMLRVLHPERAFGRLGRRDHLGADASARFCLLLDGWVQSGDGIVGQEAVAHHVAAPFA